MNFRELGERFRRAGYNVIPVKNKRPLCKSWGPGREPEGCEWEGATGIALVGGPQPNKRFLVIFDLETYPIMERFREALIKITETDVSATWFYRTGVRCPECYEKHQLRLVGATYECESCGAEFTPDSGPARGYGAVLAVDGFEGEPRTIRAGTVEILINNYQLLPPSEHPSGVVYEWVTPHAEEIPEGRGPVVISYADFLRLVRELGGEEEELRGGRKEELRKGWSLGESQVRAIVKALRGFYEPGKRDLIVLYLTGWLRKAGVDYESARKVVEALAEGDEEREMRLYVLDRTYGLKGNPPDPKALMGATGLRELLEGEYGPLIAEGVTNAIEEILREKPEYEEREVNGLRVLFPLEESAFRDKGRLVILVGRSLLLNMHVTYHAGEFYVYEDGVWRPEGAEDRIWSLAKRIAQAMGVEEKALAWLRNNLFVWLKGEVYRRVSYDKWLLVFDNGVLNVREFVETGKLELKAHSPKMFAVHRIPHKLRLDLYEGLAEEERIDPVKALKKLAPTIYEAMVAWVRKNPSEEVALEECQELEEDTRRKVLGLIEWCGYALYPDYPIHRALMLVGEGRNGKSTFLWLVKSMLGKENVTAHTLQELSENRFAPINLYRKLANICADLPRNPLRYTGMFKMLTGGDTISADRKFKDPITFVNYAKLMFSANQLPRVSDETHAFWRRWCLVEFPNKFPEDRTFTRRLYPEIEGLIIATLIALRGLLERGDFAITGDFKEEWERRTNSVYAFVETGREEGWLEVDPKNPNLMEDKDVLYAAYVEWVKEAAWDYEFTAMSKKAFTEELERLFGIQRRRETTGARKWKYAGIKLKKTTDDRKGVT